MPDTPRLRDRREHLAHLISLTQGGTPDDHAADADRIMTEFEAGHGLEAAPLDEELTVTIEPGYHMDE